MSASTIKLLYMHNGYLIGSRADSIQVMKMCRVFSECGLDVTLAVCDYNATQDALRQAAFEILGEMPNFKIETYRRYSLAGRLRTYGAFVGVLEYMRKNAHRFTHCYARNPNFSNAAIRYNLKTVYEAHERNLNNSSKIINSLMLRTLLKDARNPLMLRFVSITNYLDNHWANLGIPREKMMVLPDCVDMSNFHMENEQGELREELELPQDRQIVTYAGSMTEDRGIDNIVRLAEDFPETWFLALGGTDEQAAFYRQMAEGKGVQNIRFTGFVPHHEVKNYLYASDVLLMIWTSRVPSIAGCSPLKMFEYMATGRVIAGTAFPTIKEVLEDGVTAFLAEPDDYEELEKCVRRALSAPDARDIAVRARQLALDNYTWKKRAETILAQIVETEPAPVGN